MIAFAMLLRQNLIRPGKITVWAGIFGRFRPAVSAADYLIFRAAGAEEFRVPFIIDYFLLAGDTGYANHGIVRTVVHL